MNVNILKQSGNKVALYLTRRSVSSIFDFTVQDIKGNDVHLSKFDNQVTFIVNVASKWGFTKKNYAQLNDLHDHYSEKGLRILAFPCNQFGGQEAGTNDEICKFTNQLGVKFDVFSKLEVNGDKAHPLFHYLQNHQTGLLSNAIKWNFSKFLCDRNGIPVARYSPTTEPFSCVDDIERELEK